MLWKSHYIGVYKDLVNADNLCNLMILPDVYIYNTLLLHWLLIQDIINSINRALGLTQTCT